MMRSRSRFDYMALSSQENDPLRYKPLEPTADFVSSENTIPAEGISTLGIPAAAIGSNRVLYLPEPPARAPLPSSRFSSIDKGFEMDRIHPLPSESVVGPHYHAARSNHFEVSSNLGGDRFAFSVAGERSLLGRSTLGLSDRVPVCTSGGEYVKSQPFDHAVRMKDGSLSAASVLQRQSSGSSLTDSLMSSDIPLSSLSPTVSMSASDSGAFVETQDGTKGAGMSSGSKPSWAQHAEQSYNLQLALALRLVAEAEMTEEPILMQYSNFENQSLLLTNANSSVQSTSLRFWVNGSLGYADRIRDGFYHVWGMNPYVWGLCSHLEEDGGRLPRLDLLRGVDPKDTSMEVIVVDKHSDSHLCELQAQAFNLAHSGVDSSELATLLGKLVCENMGGAAATELGDLTSRWKACSAALKECLNCVVFPIGSLSVGVCRHRALLFKALADNVNLPCRIARGCKYCGRDDGFSCLVLCGSNREVLVDLIANPGELCCPEALLKSLPPSKIPSPLRLPEWKTSEISGNDVLEWQTSRSGVAMAGVASSAERGASIHPVCDNKSALNGTVNGTGAENIRCINPAIPVISVSDSNSPQVNTGGKMKKPIPRQDIMSLADRRSVARNLVSPTEESVNAVKQSTLERHVSFAEVDLIEEIRQEQSEHLNTSSPKPNTVDLFSGLEDFEIAWEDLTVKERIGAGSFGTVHRADWNGSDVAVKVFVEQDFLEERLDEFMREVAILKRARHPNVVLFMGVVLKRPNLSIVTEYLPRGSLFRLLHRPGMRELLDERRRIRMALDVARGMNYLHRLNPPIVHRDLKSPNLLVDKTWTVKVCDFGLSRLKMKTFLSSRSAAGTAEWMAPEVLRDEPSNEKSDVYSFGIIMWELFTLQQPWSGLSPAQVVGAVGFQHRRLPIPKELNPEIAALIEACWANDPRQRPSFASIMESLKPLQKLTSSEGGRHHLRNMTDFAQEYL